jgi:hypothetical protein
MRNEGWTWADLAGELISRGIDPDYVGDISGVLDAPSPEIAARCVAADVPYDPPSPREDWDGEVKP